MIRDTSVLAFNQLDLAAKQAKVIQFLARYPSVEFTRQEIANNIREPINCVCGRVNELVRAGRLEEGPRRQCSVTTHSAHTIKIAAHLVEKVAA